MKKSRFLLCGILIAGSLTVACAAAFAKSAVYTPGTFTDVPAEEWYASEVANAYELGLMNGIGNGLFSPEGNVTVAEAVTMAARVASQSKGEAIPEAEGEWYSKYVNYAAACGFLPEGGFDDYERAAKRFEVASLFCDALPASEYPAKNNVTDIPDVSASRPYRGKLLTLYNAGVVMGSDAYGNFHPLDAITRAEAAAIIGRVALPESRLQKTLEKVACDDAYTLVYNESFTRIGSGGGINSGWRLDNRGGSPRTSEGGTYGALADVSETYGTAMIREFNTVSTGKIRLQTRYTVSAGGDGAYIEFRNTADKPVYRLEMRSGAWAILGTDGRYTPVFERNGATLFTFDISVDLDNGRSTTTINGTDCGSHPLAASDSVNLKNYRYGTTEKSTAVITSTKIQITANYALYEDFAWQNGTEPVGWSTQNARAGGSLTLSENGSAYKAFAPVSGIAVAETSFFPGSKQHLSFAMLSGNTPIVVFTSDDNAFYANGVNVYDGYSTKCWYDLRVEADTESGEALIKVNGRKVGSVPFAAETATVDGISVANFSADDLTFYHFKVFRKILHDDYVPAPVRPAGEEKYNVGINICSLWRNGTHYGWSVISPFDDIRPVLGYYDEGNPETADWEIKYMVEHGIDFQAFCWFAFTNAAYMNTNTLHNGVHLHEGYMNAEYSDQMKYCLLWEVANGGRPQNMKQWAEYFVPFWIEHYFKDPRYMTIDNRLLLYVFTPDKLYGNTGFGSPEDVKKAFDYLEEEVKKLGFDGMIYVADNAASSDTLKACGFDATAAYNWGSDGYQYEVNVKRNESNAQNKAVFTIPTASVGFNNVGWAGTRYPLMTPEDFKKTNLWMRDEFSPEIAEKGSWQENLYMISTWNEYGEGTYVMPTSGELGFGYLDALREVYTDEKAADSVNLIPTAAQSARINRLYPQDERLLRKNGDYVKPGKVYDPKKMKPVLSVNPGTAPGGINPAGIENFTKSEDGIAGVTVSNDNYLAFGNGHSLDLTTCSVVRITAKIPVGETMRFYFTTNVDDSWNESKAINTTKSETEDYADYYFDFGKNPYWKNTLKWFRIDPSAVAGSTFAIAKIDFLAESAASVDEIDVIHIGANDVELQIPPQRSENGDYLLAFDPQIGLEFLLNVHYRWDKAAGKLTIYADKHTVVYTVGSETYTLDGKEQPLGFTLDTFDGLPLIPIQKFCKDVGYTFTTSADGVHIETTEKADKPAFFAARENRVPLSWEFNVNGDLEGWTSPHMSLLAADGYLSCESNGTSTDPVLNHGVDRFPADRYTKLQFRVRYDYTPKMEDVLDEEGKPTGEQKQVWDYESLTLYFATADSPSLSEGKTIKCRLKSNSSHGEWEEYEVDIDNEAWTGYITAIRFDPFNAVGHIDIDYFRIVEDPDYEAKLLAAQNAPKKFEIVNGDAEDPKVAFISANANISIVEDPEDENNHCYLFLPKENKEAWTYAIQEVYFHAGKTYQIDYDIRLASYGREMVFDPDLQASTLCNFQYRVPGTSSSDHVVEGSAGFISMDAGWVHVSRKYTVSAGMEGENTAKQRFSIFANPVNHMAIGFYLDNVVVTELED